MPVKTPREFDRRGRRIVTWTRTQAGRACARHLMVELNAKRHLKPKCGAKSKSTGEPCRQVAMANGRCVYHGGSTPSGDNWHKPRWPKANAPGADAKLGGKLRDLDLTARKRERRLAAMTPEQREQYRRWQAAHKPGPAAKRRSARLPGVKHVKLDEPASSLATSTAPEFAELNRLLGEAKARLDSLTNENLGIFG
ncbi:hypothetical protein J2Y55_001116 [Bosea sp. BE125]|uniref:hypothetical protein n=1 Tax=Bosea sp. BE125 TaxID=2817909 RepID=UPI0028640F74|nr:hypothetical protein [Bosea sp. BE125]MDR6870116.1 hypothetical protein [Bosea sp. BE125]